MAIYQEFPVAKELNFHFLCSWFFDGTSGPLRPNHTILPDNSIDIIFDFSNNLKHPVAFVSGMMTKPLHSDRTRLVGLRFRPWTAYPYFNLPLGQMRDLSVELGDVLNKKRSEKFQPIFDQNFHPKVIKDIEKVVTNDLPSFGRLDPRIAKVVQLPIKKVTDISMDLNLGRQQVTRLFKQNIGISPQQFFRIQRLNRVLEFCSNQKRSTVCWSEVAYRFGYTDQSHFIHDFKRFSGATPAQYFAKS